MTVKNNNISRIAEMLELEGVLYWIQNNPSIWENNVVDSSPNCLVPFRETAFMLLKNERYNILHSDFFRKNSAILDYIMYSVRDIYKDNHIMTRVEIVKVDAKSHVQQFSENGRCDTHWKTIFNLGDSDITLNIDGVLTPYLSNVGYIISRTVPYIIHNNSDKTQYQLIIHF